MSTSTGRSERVHRDRVRLHSREVKGAGWSLGDSGGGSRQLGSPRDVALAHAVEVMEGHSVSYS